MFVSSDTTALRTAVLELAGAIASVAEVEAELEVPTTTALGAVEDAIRLLNDLFESDDAEAQKVLQGLAESEKFITSALADQGLL